MKIYKEFIVLFKNNGIVITNTAVKKKYLIIDNSEFYSSKVKFYVSIIHSYLYTPKKYIQNSNKFQDTIVLIITEVAISIKYVIVNI